MKKFSIGKIIFILLFIITITFLYGKYIEPKLIKTNNYQIKTSKITNNFDGLKIVHISDIHYGRNFYLSDLKLLVKKINEQKPDIVVLTGDLLDRNCKLTTTSTNDISQQLNNIKAKSGKYIISGDEDAQFDEWENIIGSCNFINLNNSYDTIYNKGYDYILIAGVSSFQDKESIINKNQKTQNFINTNKNKPIYKILLMHEPDYIDDFDENNYDLVLAGHNLNGQIYLPALGPLIKKEGAKKYSSLHYKIKTTDLYISNGIGTSNLKFRLFNNPSYNVYRLRNN